MAYELDINVCFCQSLSLNSNSIGADGAKEIVNKTLTSLELDNNGIGAGAQALGEALRVNKTLTSLELDNNGIGDAGAQALGEALRANKVLQTLNVASNRIGDQGAAAFADALKVNTTVQTLNIGYNNLGDKCAALIAEAIKFNKILHEINLGWNKIGDAGAQAIGEALKVNPILKQLVGVELKNHIQGLPQGVSDNERILEYLRKQSKIREDILWLKLLLLDCAMSPGRLAFEIRTYSLSHSTRILWCLIALQVTVSSADFFFEELRHVIRTVSI
eukprot:g15491.t1